MTQVAVDAFGNALGNSITTEDWNSGSQTAAPDKPKADMPTQSYWDTHPMLYASNDVADPSQSKTVMDDGNSTSVLRLSSGSPDGVDAKLNPEDEVATRRAAQEAARLQKIRDDADAVNAVNALKVYAAIGRGENLAPTIENAARLGLYDTSSNGVPVKFSESMPSGSWSLGGWSGTPAAESGISRYQAPMSESGWQGFLEGARGEFSVMETPTTAKTLGGYVRTGGQILNSMFNPKEVAQGMWSAIDNGNPLEIGVAALGFFPAGTVAKAGTVEKALLQAELSGTKPLGPFSRLVDGGGLKAHELAGGHLLDRHVEKSAQQLLDRLAADSRITGSSSF